MEFTNIGGIVLTIPQITIGLGVITAISTALVFLLNKLISKTQHEVNQDNKIKSIENFRTECTIERRKAHDLLSCRIDKLERRDTDREITLAQIKEQITHVQTMILQLTENQHQTFTTLIDTIKEFRNK